MPRTRLDTAKVVDAAQELVQADGVAALTLGAVARSLGIATPSLYNHIDSFDHLRQRLAYRSMAQLSRRLQSAAAGRAGDEAIAEVMRAFRRFALDEPALYELTVTVPPDDPELVEAADRVAATVLATLRSRDLVADDIIHAARTIRSAVHGFVDLERRGGFGLPTDVEESFERMISTMCAGLPG